MTSSTHSERKGEGDAPDTAAGDPVFDAFEAAWRRGERPTPESFLPADAAGRLTLLANLLHLDLEYRIKAGEAVRVEDYLAPGRFPELADNRELLLSLIAAEYRFRSRASPVVPEEYLKRFPTLADDVARRLLETSIAPPPPLQMTIPERQLERLDRYQIVRPLGRGAMGAVYLAYDPLLERHVALKAPHASPGSVLAARFADEARAAARLRHPNLCPVYDAGESDGVPFLAMAYIEGRPLTEAFPPPLPPSQAADLVRRLAVALQEAHGHGVVHRDLKPANILVTAAGEPVVVDFGLARRDWSDDERSTLPGQIMGTPAYMAPEQAAGRMDLVGPQSDIYSLGVIFFELLTDRLPFRGPVPNLLEQAISADAPPPARFRSDLDPQLDEICLRALARRMERRFATMSEFAGALAAWLEDHRRRSPPAETPKPAEPAFDPRAAEDVLALLREWGWEQALAKIKKEMETAEGPRRAALRVLLGWLAGDLGHYDEADVQLRAAEAAPPLAGWALAGRAVVALRERRMRSALDLLGEAAASEGADAALLAAVAHLRGAVALHEGRDTEAFARLHEALEGFGSQHFGAGRVLDTLGMAHAGRNNFPAACAFYQESLVVKKRHGDDAGLALTHGQLGRLMLDWDRLDEAETYFREGLALSRRIGDGRGEAVLHNQRGRVLLARGRAAEAKPFLDESVRAAGGRWQVIEAYTRKDLALALVALGRLEEAEEAARQAEATFQSISLAEGFFHVQAAWGAVRRAQGRMEEAARHYRNAAAGFERQGEHAEAARALWELARAERSPALAVQALLAALDEAERGRRDHLRTPIAQELRAASELDWARRELGRRVPGPAEREETATILAAELRSEGGADDLPALLLLRNHLYADLAPALTEHGAAVVQHRGDGFLALVRGPENARRGVAAALAVARALAQWNRPRRVLDWPLWRIHIGVASGSVFVGEVGPWDRPDSTAVGPAAAQAEALRQASGSEAPCVSDDVRRMAAAAFAFRPRGLNVWEVVGPALA